MRDQCHLFDCYQELEHEVTALMRKYLIRCLWLRQKDNLMIFIDVTSIIDESMRWIEMLVRHHRDYYYLR